MKHLPKRIKLGVPLVFMAALAYAGFSWWQAPATVTGTDTTTQVSSVLGAETQLTNWQTAYFSSKIPSELHVKSSIEQPERPIIGQYLLTDAVGTHGDQVAVTIGTLHTGTIAEVSAVKLRTSLPDTYVPATIPGVTDVSFAFTKLDSTETSIFWQHGTQYVAIVATATPDRSATLQQILSTLHADWQWNQ